MVSGQRLNLKATWAYSCGAPLRKRLLPRATMHGLIDMMSWLHAHGCEWERDLDG
jgi:hypothetical protein